MTENITLRKIALGRVEMLWEIESIVNDPSTNDVEKWESIQKVYKDNPDCLTLDFIEDEDTNDKRGHQP